MKDEYIDYCKGKDIEESSDNEEQDSETDQSSLKTTCAYHFGIAMSVVVDFEFDNLVQLPLIVTPNSKLNVLLQLLKHMINNVLVTRTRPQR